MAVVHYPAITLNFKDGSTRDFSGEPAKYIYQQMRERATGVSLRNGLTFINDEELEEYIEYDCLCGYVLGEPTEETVPERECKQIDCFK